MKGEDIGARMKQRRKELDLSAMDIAAKTGLSKATIHRYESGDIKHIKLPVVETIAALLKVNPDWLIGKSEERDANDNEMLMLIDKAIEVLEELRDIAEKRG